MGDCFYAEGLHFECTRCSQCCRGAPGYVFLSRDDIKALVAGLGLPERLVLSRYCRTVRVGGFQKVSLQEKPNYDCIFWRTKGCLVYAHRPLQCRSYPFWSANLQEERRWEELKGCCPGVGRGRLHSGEEIREWLRRSREQRYLSGLGAEE
jgi:Fe-S-cluster containining protein